MERKQFEKLVQEAVAELPEEFRDRLQNVVIIIDDNPSPEILEQMDLEDDHTLFGLYEGTPLTERGFGAPLQPDRIWIFQQPIEETCDTEEEIRDEIKITIVHEVAHFFGLDDDYLEDIGY
jgi:predicted Zn-dependent protease with MMP-like domain